jgi:hypothetical protein
MGWLVSNIHKGIFCYLVIGYVVIYISIYGILLWDLCLKDELGF